MEKQGLVSKRPNKFADKMCQCGHLKSEHGGAMNHLACRRAPTECSCIRFTWKHFVDKRGR